MTASPPRLPADFDGGMACFARGDFAAAAAAFRRAAAEMPEYAPTYSNLAVVLRRLDDDPGALAALKRGAAADPVLPEVWSNLGSLLRDLRQLDASLAALRRGLLAVPRHPAGLCNLGNTLLDLGRYHEAATAYRAALDVRPNLPEAHKNLGHALLLLGDLRNGFAEYEWRLQVENLLDLKGELPWPRWRGEPLAGKTLLAVTEQGYGDVIQFARYGRLIERMGGRMLLTCQPPLVRLMQGAEGVAGVVAGGSRKPACDAWAPLMSLPHHLGTGLESVPQGIPYIHADPELSARWGAVLADVPRPRVGIVWAGSTGHLNDHNRSIPLDALIPLLAGVDAGFVSLQKDPRPGDAARLALLPGLCNPAPGFTDFTDTAAVIDHLDLVVAVDTSVVHLAGAMGKPAWVLLPCVPDWRWLLNRDDSPWYPGMRLFRQPRPGDWTAVLAALGGALRTFAAQARRGVGVT